jgi:hypothetical protein
MDTVHYATQDSHFIHNKSWVPHISLVFREMWGTQSPLEIEGSRRSTWPPPESAGGLRPR